MTLEETIEEQQRIIQFLMIKLYDLDIEMEDPEGFDMLSSEFLTVRLIKKD